MPCKVLELKIETESILRKYEKGFKSSRREKLAAFKKRLTNPNLEKNDPRVMRAAADYLIISVDQAPQEFVSYNNYDATYLAEEINSLSSIGFDKDSFLENKEIIDKWLEILNKAIIYFNEKIECKIEAGRNYDHDKAILKFIAYLNVLNQDDKSFYEQNTVIVDNNDLKQNIEVDRSLFQSNRQQNPEQLQELITYLKNTAFRQLNKEGEHRYNHYLDSHSFYHHNWLKPSSTEINDI